MRIVPPMLKPPQKLSTFKRSVLLCAIISILVFIFRTEIGIESPILDDCETWILMSLSIMILLIIGSESEILDSNKNVIHLNSNDNKNSENDDDAFVAVAAKGYLLAQNRTFKDFGKYTQIPELLGFSIEQGVNGINWYYGTEQPPVELTNMIPPNLQPFIDEDKFQIIALKQSGKKLRIWSFNSDGELNSKNISIGEE